MPDQPTFGIRLAKESFVFSSAHFITYAGDVCERLHGHNYRVTVELTGALDDNAYVLDFVATQRSIAEITAELDHRVMLPTGHELIEVAREGDGETAEIVARFREKRWVFPADDCVLLDVPNTTAEKLAEWIGRRLLVDLGQTERGRSFGLTVEVQECDGQSGLCRF